MLPPPVTAANTPRERCLNLAFSPVSLLHLGLMVFALFSDVAVNCLMKSAVPVNIYYLSVFNNTIIILTDYMYIYIYYMCDLYYPTLHIRGCPSCFFEVVINFHQLDGKFCYFFLSTFRMSLSDLGLPATLSMHRLSNS